MSYAALSDIENAAGGAANLVALADFGNTGATDPSLSPCIGPITSAMDGADGLINTYLNKRFSVPLPVVTPYIVRLAARLAVFELRDSRGQLSQADVERHAIDITWLEQVRDGLQVPGLEPLPPPSSLQGDVAGDRDPIKQVSRQRLKGFW